MGVLTTEIIVNSDSYIFDGAGGMRDQLEQTILQELDEKKYPLKVAIENVQSGGVFWGTTEQCVTVGIGQGHRVVIANTTVGTYLYVHIYHLVRVINTKNQINLATSVITDIFATQKTYAAYAAAVAAAESAFAKLELKQCNSGYRSTQHRTAEED